VLTVLVPFLFWKQTWFGQRLTDEQITEYLSENEKPRHIQQALVQIEERIEQGDASVERWYPRMAELKDSPIAELRVTLAWVLGTDNQSGLFHETLLEMLDDGALLVRRNAALSLVRFGDASGRKEILQMLEPITVHANETGVLDYRLDEGASVETGTVLARVARTDGSAVEVRSPAPGRISGQHLEDGAPVAAGDAIATLAPADGHVWEGLRALLLVGEAEDLQLVERFVHSSEEEYPARIREQAVLTAAALRERTIPGS
jgi:hypothetical protein